MNFFIKVYFWQTTSLIFNIVSLFIVVPYLTQNINQYSIYSLFFGLYTLINYLDFGISQSATTQLVEFYQNKDKKNEIYILTLFSNILFYITSVAFLFLAYGILYPQVYIKNALQEDLLYYKYLFAIGSLFVGQIYFQKISIAILGIRQMEFLIYRSNTIISIIRLFAILCLNYFGIYSIILYFFILQFLAFLNSIFLYVYSIRSFGVQLNKNLFLKLNDLGYLKIFKISIVNLLAYLSFISYYEVDYIYHSKFNISQTVALYGISYTILSFIRMAMGSLFSPFLAKRYLYYNDYEGMSQYNAKVISLTAPIVIFSILLFFFNSNIFILKWVGIEYLKANVIFKYLLLVNLFAFISYPISETLILLKKYKQILFLSILLPAVYWVFIFMFKNILGVSVIAISKFLVFMIAAFFYCIIFFKNYDLKLSKLIKPAFSISISILWLFISSIYINKYLYNQRYSLFVLCIFLFFVYVVSFILLLLTSKMYKNLYLSILSSIFNNYYKKN